MPAKAFLAGCFLVCGLALNWSAPRAAAQKEDPKAEKVPPYTFTFTVMGEAIHTLRLKISTGESWLTSGSKWMKIAEAAAIPAGDYEVAMITTDKDFTAIRFDRKSGTMWQLKDRKWTKIEEPD